MVASIQVDLSEEVLRRFRAELLELIHSSGAAGMILDVSGVEVMDYRDFEALQRIMAMARLMGAPSVLAGVQAGVVSSLVELGLDTDKIVAALDLDEAFRVMERLHTESQKERCEEDEYDDIASAHQL